ncbi:uncharacterized protein LOC113332967 [Papaver somniferum]|uniref:uncharacterized protein LOC113332967 n=1 Tax=Papaver somniferum TaxID=3469 RepID=UPI000E702477|nr:uncharacterized protein LOC113332967 [Papaver somniferum]
MPPRTPLWLAALKIFQQCSFWSLPEHSHFAAYEPWRFNWSEMPLGYPTPPPGLLKDRKKRDPTTESPASDQEDDSAGPQVALGLAIGRKKRDRPVVSPVSNQNDPINPPTALVPAKRTRRTLNLAEITQVKDSKPLSRKIVPPPKQPSGSTEGTSKVKGSVEKGTVPILSIVDVEELPEKLPKEMSKGKKKKKRFMILKILHTSLILDF